MDTDNTYLRCDCCMLLLFSSRNQRLSSNSLTHRADWAGGASQLDVAECGVCGEVHIVTASPYFHIACRVSVTAWFYRTLRTRSCDIIGNVKLSSSSARCIELSLGADPRFQRLCSFFDPTFSIFLITFFATLIFTAHMWIELQVYIPLFCCSKVKEI